MNQFSKLLGAGDKLVVSVKGSDSYFKLVVNHFGSVLKVSHVMMKDEIENNGCIDFEVSGIEKCEVVSTTKFKKCVVVPDKTVPYERQEVGQESCMVSLEGSQGSDNFEKCVVVPDTVASFEHQEVGQASCMVSLEGSQGSDNLSSEDDIGVDPKLYDSLAVDIGESIHKVAGSSKSSVKQSSKTAVSIKKGKGSQQQSISLVSSQSSQGSGSGNNRFVRSPMKQGKFVRTGVNKKVSNVYSIRIKHGEFLLVFAEDGRRQFMYSFPGTRIKAWCTAFERDLKDKQAWPAGESRILNIVKRRDIRDSGGDTPLAQLNSQQYFMNAYLCAIGPDDTPASISESIVAKINEYGRVSTNNMKHFRYWHEVTDGYDNDSLHALDYWVVTSDIVETVNDLYDQELQDDSFYEYPRLLEGLFERDQNTRDIMATVAGMTFRGGNN